MNRRRILLHSGVWIVVLALIIVSAGRKAAENSRQRAESAEWHSKITQLTGAGLKQRDALVARIRDLHGQPNSRQQLEAEFNGGKAFAVTADGDRLAAAWIDPTYGMRSEVGFEADKLVSHSVQWGTGDLTRVYPEPPRIAFTSRNEQVRQLAVALLPWLWGLSLAVFLLVPVARLVASETMLALAIAYGTAQLVAPVYNLTINGIFSNDALFFSAVMLLVSTIAVSAKFRKPAVRLELPTLAQNSPGPC